MQDKCCLGRLEIAVHCCVTWIFFCYTSTTDALTRRIPETRSTARRLQNVRHKEVLQKEGSTEERDGITDQLSNELRHSKEEVSALQTGVKEAEMNSRLPCLVLSGTAMAPRHAPRLEPPLPAQTAPAAAGQHRPAAERPGQGQPGVMSQSADRRDSAGRTPDQSAAGTGGGWRGVAWEERENVNALVVTTLNRCMPGPGIDTRDIDRVHRLPGPNNREIVCFVRLGQGSIQDQVIMRRLELRGRDLFVNESLTSLRS